MTIAVDKLTALGAALRRPSAYQLKVGGWNYYPGKKTIQQDDHCACPERGLEAFIEKLVEANLIR